MPTVNDAKLADVNHKLQGLNKPLLHLRKGYGKGYGKYGIDKGDDHNLTGLMTKNQLYDWLCAFEAGVDYINPNA